MAKADNLKLTILVDGNPIYFGAPVFYSMKVDGSEEIAIIQTEVGNTTKQRIEIQIKNVNYVEPIILEQTKPAETETSTGSTV